MVEREAGMPGLATQLNHLFATVPRPGTSQLWNNEDAAAAMREAGVNISAAYLSQLRTGKRDNPSARHLGALARLFRVPVDYFFDPAVSKQIDADLRLLVAVRDANVQGIALRAHGLSATGLSGIAGMIEHIRRMERLEDTTNPDQPPPPSEQ
ncbi:helix-turn-helix domain-containing protein [Nakamurella endophytica]|uniref:XRE family transcriptional regulator n=1 Tax=Nakamurella endophytica TaxID=1748367 RepID=A0A917TA07_9ACTN|nr:helix-turn-helix domain-containing protein [Nakamurella endophytica]GGM15996.1 XRE family transcriptional regulator [Nakamurella endophytica]